MRAIKCFLAGDLGAFDPLVGDTGCHKRAIPLAEICAKLKSSSSFRTEIEQVLAHTKKTVGILNQLRKKDRKNQDLPLLEFFRKCSIDTPVSEDLRFIILCYLLTTTKLEQNIKDLTISDRLKKIAPRLVMGECQKIVRHAQVLLATDSHKRLVGYAEEIHRSAARASYDTELLRLMIGKDYQKYDIDNRPSNPCFYEIKTLLIYQLLNSRPIILLARPSLDEEVGNTNAVALTYLPINGKYQKVDAKGLDLDECALVIEGTCELPLIPQRGEHQHAAKIEGHDVLAIILANAAAHPQYHGTLRDHQIEHEAAEREVSEWAEHAKQMGCCQENPHLFVIRHIYTTNVSEVFQFASTSARSPSRQIA